jgi:Holliday junction resolvase RusA-like endonuclease
MAPRPAARDEEWAVTSVCTILGPPRTKNTGDIVPVPGTRRFRVIPSKNYRAWFKQAKQQVPFLRQQLATQLPIRGRVEVTAIWYRDRNVGDEDNFKKGLGDFLERSGILANDKQIHWGGGCRLDKDAARPRIEVAITELVAA